MLSTAGPQIRAVNDGTLHSEIQEIQANIVELKNKFASLESKSCMYKKIILGYLSSLRKRIGKKSLQL